MRRRAKTFAEGLLLLLSLPAIARAAATTSAPRPFEAAPGSVVRWDGEGTTRCGNEHESWEPQGGSCWFPVDLLLAEGTLLPVTRWRGDTREDAALRVSANPYPVEKVRVSDRYAHPSARNLERAKREGEKVALLWPRRSPGHASFPLAPPMKGAPPPRNFGTRRVVNGEPRNPHGGADYPAPTGTPVLAVAPGKVVLADEHFFSGRSVYLDHGDGLLSMYFHLDSIGVRPGETVAAGARLGTVGATGRVSGPHLHFALRWKGARIDPRPLLGDPSEVPRL
jgi:murein DD-endopeptidase MepM/ murein hydrolase activator NlpD